MYVVIQSFTNTLPAPSHDCMPYWSPAITASCTLAMSYIATYFQRLCSLLSSWEVIKQTQVSKLGLYYRHIYIYIYMCMFLSKDTCVKTQRKTYKLWHVKTRLLRTYFARHGKVLIIASSSFYPEQLAISWLRPYSDPWFSDFFLVLLIFFVLL